MPLIQRSSPPRQRPARASDPAPHAAGVEHALGVEAVLDAPGDAGERALLRLEHVDRRACGNRRPNQRGVAAGRCRGPSNRSGAGAVRRRQRDPDQAAGPVIEPLRRAGAWRRTAVARGRGRDPPQAANRRPSRRPRTARRQDAAPEAANAPVDGLLRVPNGCSRAISASLRCLTDGAKQTRSRLRGAWTPAKCVTMLRQ